MDTMKTSLVVNVWLSKRSRTCVSSTLRDIVSHPVLIMI